ncbi:MAG TPA: hypothetical protein VE422_22000 [Terriglobia bacterium]|nr:hypothetical protein [Terriglobia bacterium]
MKKNFVLLLAGVVILSVVAISIAAQSGSAKAVPRLANGKPDFTGVWDHPRVGDVAKDANGKCAGETNGCKNTGAGDLPFTSLGKAENEKKDKWDYGAHCMPWGYVRSYGTPYPHAYVHHPDRLVVVWEQDNAYHMIPTDGRPLPKDPEPTWRGTSVGHWEGDTLVIETVGFNGRTWLDTAEHPHSDQLRVVERMTRPDYDHINYEVTMEDPKFYSKPMKNLRTFVLMKPGQELYEYSCAENNRCESGNCTPADVQK